MSGFGSIARGMLPLRTLLQAFQPEHWRRLASVEREAERQLEDLGISVPTTPTAEANQEKSEKTEEKSEIVQMMRSFLDKENTPEQRARVQAAEMLDEAIVEHAQKTADRVAGWPPKLFGNLLPWVLILHFTYRLVRAWMDGSWLPFDFYLHGLAIFLLSLIPGWIQLGVRMRSLAEAPDPEAVLRYLESPAQTVELRRFTDICTTLLRDINETRSFIKRQLNRLGGQLEQMPGSEYGNDSSAKTLEHE